MDGDPRIDKLMLPVAKAIKDSLNGKWSSGIYNRAYEAVMQVVEENDNLKARAEAAEARVAELEAAQRWIPVSERLPEEMQNVLVISRDGYVYNWRHANAFMQFFVTRYTHWRPFEPPKEMEG